LFEKDIALIGRKKNISKLVNQKWRSILKSMYSIISIIIATSILCSCASKPKKSVAKLIKVRPSNAIFIYAGSKNDPNKALVKKFNRVFDKVVVKDHTVGEAVVGEVTKSILLSGVREAYMALDFEKIFEKHFFSHTENSILNVLPFNPKKKIADQYVLIVKLESFKIETSGATPRMTVSANLIDLGNNESIIWKEKFRGDDFRFTGQIGAGSKLDRANRMIKSIVDEIVMSLNK
jgi:hypothetical protein